MSPLGVVEEEAVCSPKGTFGELLAGDVGQEMVGHSSASGWWSSECLIVVGTSIAVDADDWDCPVAFDHVSAFGTVQFQDANSLDLRHRTAKSTLSLQNLLGR